MFVFRLAILLADVCIHPVFVMPVDQTPIFQNTKGAARLHRLSGVVGNDQSFCAFTVVVVFTIVALLLFAGIALAWLSSFVVLSVKRKTRRL